MSVREKLASIETKVNHLGESHNRIKVENNRLKVEAEILRKRLAEQDKVINELENKNVNLHIARPVLETAGQNDAIRQKIDRYIKEIDKCIELLNS